MAAVYCVSLISSLWDLDSGLARNGCSWLDPIIRTTKSGQAVLGYIGRDSVFYITRAPA